MFYRVKGFPCHFFNLQHMLAATARNLSRTVHELIDTLHPQPPKGTGARLVAFMNSPTTSTVPQRPNTFHASTKSHCQPFIPVTGSLSQSSDDHLPTGNRRPRRRCRGPRRELPGRRSPCLLWGHTSLIHCVTMCAWVSQAMRASDLHQTGPRTKLPDKPH
jgi:hypothetical protein